MNGESRKTRGVLIGLVSTLDVKANFNREPLNVVRLCSPKKVPAWL
jgi:hypothetical protein